MRMESIMASRPRASRRAVPQMTRPALPAGLKGGLTPKQITQVLRSRPGKTLTVAGQRRALALALLHQAGQQGGQ